MLRRKSQYTAFVNFNFGNTYTTFKLIQFEMPKYDMMIGQNNLRQLYPIQMMTEKFIVADGYEMPIEFEYQSIIQTDKKPTKGKTM